MQDEMSDFEEMMERSMGTYSDKGKEAQNRINNLMKKIEKELDIKHTSYSFIGNKIDYIKDGNEKKVDLKKIPQSIIKELEEKMKIINKERKKEKVAVDKMMENLFNE